jgi:hypothetical protein
MGCGRSIERSPLATASPSVAASSSSSVTTSVTTSEPDSPTGVVDEFLRDETNWDANAMLSRSCVETRSDMQNAITARETPQGSGAQVSTPASGELSVRLHLAQTAADSARVQVEGSITYASPVGVVDIAGVYTVRRENGNWCVATSNLSGNAG